MQRQLPLIGVLMMLAAAACLASKDGIAKLLVGDTHPLFLVWAQYAVTWVVLAPVVIWKHGAAALLPRPITLQFARGLFSSLVIAFFFLAIQFIPLAEAHAMVFIGPLLATALSPFVLKEKVGPHRLAAVVVGFSGILLILRPDFSAASGGHFLALAAGVMVAFYFMANRKAAGFAPPLASVAHSVAIGSVLLLPFLPWLASAPQPGSEYLFGLFFIIAIAGQCLAVMSFSFGEASLIAPFHYTQIISSVAFGYVVFNHFPDNLTLAGIAIVIISGVYIAVREARIHRSVKV